jgi:hypothetical protein
MPKSTFEAGFVVMGPTLHSGGSPNLTVAFRVRRRRITQ